MTTQISRLANGMTVVTHAMPHLETVSLGIWVSAGARHETKAEHGISHFIEHMAFKGTERRSARAIAEEIEQVGGELNAATSLETTAYYARVLKGDEGVALDILSDILQSSQHAAEEIEREREVILQEIAATKDSPDEIAYDLIHDVAFPDQPVGRPILGTPASVRSFQVDDLRRFITSHYGASRMVLSAAGGVDHGLVVRHAEALFGGLSSGGAAVQEVARYGGGVRAFDKSFEQTHVLLGFEAPPYRRPEFYTGQVFSGLLGGGMSSRLFQEVRERRGLCYAIYSSSWGFNDSGLFCIHAATGTETMTELTEVVSRELKSLASEGPTNSEIARAKAQLKAGLLMGLESSSARAEQMARHMLVHNRLLSSAELIESVETVTADRIRDFAAQLLSGGTPSVVVVGAGRKSKGFAERFGEALAA
jgi:predicted Zn-dependent peptidase